MSIHNWNSHLDGYSDSNRIRKGKAHASARTVLRKFAQEQLGLTKDQFEVRSNKAGPAVSGEVTLHTDPFGTRGLGIYIQVSDGGSMGNRAAVMFRTCKSRKDYTGGHNNFCSIADMLAPDFVDKIKSLVNIPHYD